MTQIYETSYIITPGLARLVCRLTADLSNTQLKPAQAGWS